MRFGDLDAMQYGNYVRLKLGDSDEKAKAMLVEQIKGMIDELAKQDGFWIEQESAVYHGERIIGWKIAIPHLGCREQLLPQLRSGYERTEGR